MSEVPVDEYGYPTIFGDIMKGMEAMQDDGSLPSMVEGKEAMQGDDSLPSIKPINLNVGARKLEVNAAAKALLEDHVANGVARQVKKGLKRKQPTKKTKNLKAKMIQLIKTQINSSKQSDPFLILCTGLDVHRKEHQILAMPSK